MTEESFNLLAEKVFNLLEKDISPQLLYHNQVHTRDVLAQVQVIAAGENITDERELLLLKTAALFHDTGFIEVFTGHEPVSCNIARSMLAGIYTEEDIDEICKLIMTTAVPQSPYNKLSEILCDADLDYLGRDDYFSIGPKLKEEWFNYGIIETEADWHQRQLHFLQGHEYFTSYSLQHRKGIKQQHIMQLIKENGKL